MEEANYKKIIKTFFVIIIIRIGDDLPLIGASKKSNFINKSLYKPPRIYD